MSDQLFDPDAPTLASQDKLKVSPKGLPFVTFGNFTAFFGNYAVFFGNFTVFFGNC